MKYQNEVQFYEKGIRLHRVPTFTPNSLDIQKRGNISTFSSHSRLRLRDLLLVSNLPSSKLVGLTLTMPYDDPFKNDNCFRSVFHRFRSSFRYHFKNSAAVYRVELQYNRSPHLHIVFFLSFRDYSSLDDCSNLVYRMWLKSMPDTDFNLSGFFRHGVRFDILADNVAMFRYLTDHLSKKKVDQLGWRGRQWGVLNRHLLQTEKFVEYDLAPNQQKFFLRHICRYYRYTRSASCVFLNKKTHRLRFCPSVVWLRRKTSLSLFELSRNRVFSKNVPRRTMLM